MHIYNKIMNSNRFLTAILILILSIFICIQSLISPISRSYPKQDSSVFLYIGKSITLGETPYLDIFDHKGPIIYLINYLGNSLGNYKFVWFIELIFMFVSIYFCYKTSKLIVQSKVALVSTLIIFISIGKYFEGGNLVEEYSLPFVIISLYIFTKKYINNTIFSKTDLIVIGLTMSVVLFLRQNMISLWIVFLGCYLLQNVIKGNFKNIYSTIIYVSLGLSLVGFLVLWYLSVFGSLNEFINQYIFFNFKYSQANTENIINSAMFFLMSPLLIVSLSYYLIVVYFKKK